MASDAAAASARAGELAQENTATLAVPDHWSGIHRPPFEDDDDDDPQAGGGIRGLAIRVNVLGEALDKTQEWVGGAAMEAHEILEAAFERIGLLGCKVVRMEQLLGIASPPGTPKDEEGAQSPRSPRSPASSSARERKEEMAEGCGEEPRCTSVCGDDLGEEQQQGFAGFSSPRCSMSGEPDFPSQCGAPDLGGSFGGGRRRSRAPATSMYDPEPESAAPDANESVDGKGNAAWLRQRCTGQPDECPGMTRSGSRDIHSEKGEEGIESVKTAVTCSTPSDPQGSSVPSRCSSPAETVDGLWARMSAMELEVRALGEKVSEAGSVNTTAAGDRCSFVSDGSTKCLEPAMETRIQELIREAVRDSGPSKDSKSTTASLSGTACSLDDMRTEISRAMAAVHEDISQQQEMNSQALLADCQRQIQQLHGDIETEVSSLKARCADGSLADDLRVLKSSLQKDVSTLKTHSANLATELEACCQSQKQMADRIEAQLSASSGSSVKDVENKLHALEATSSAADNDLKTLRAKFEEDARAANSALDQRLNLLEGEVLSRGRMRAPPRVAGNGATAAAAAAAAAGLSAAMTSTGDMGTSVPASAAPHEGIVHVLTTVARLLGLLKDGEVFGKGGWNWEDGLGRRLEQAWSLQALTLDMGSHSLPARAHLFDILRGALAPPQQQLPGVGAGTALGRCPLPDKREGARLNQWLASPAQPGTGAPQQPSRPPTPTRNQQMQELEQMRQIQQMQQMLQQTEDPQQQQQAQPLYEQTQRPPSYQPKPTQPPTHPRSFKTRSSSASAARGEGLGSTYPVSGLEQAFNTVERLRQTMT